MSKAVVITGVGRDRVGIVAEMANALFESGCNLLDSSMTLLRGQFAIILMVSLPADLSLERFEERIVKLSDRLDMQINVRPLNDDELDDSGEQENPHMISVYGADRPGIVAGICRELVKLNVNITDVQTKHSNVAAQNTPLFLMILEVEVPVSVSSSTLENELNTVGKQLGVDITVQTLEVVDL